MWESRKPPLQGQIARSDLFLCLPVWGGWVVCSPVASPAGGGACWLAFGCWLAGGCLLVCSAGGLVAGALLAWIGLQLAEGRLFVCWTAGLGAGGILGWNTSCWWPVCLLFVGGRLFACVCLFCFQFVNIPGSILGSWVGWNTSCLTGVSPATDQAPVASASNGVADLGDERDPQ